MMSPADHSWDHKATPGRPPVVPTTVTQQAGLHLAIKGCGPLLWEAGMTAWRSNTDLPGAWAEVAAAAGAGSAWGMVVGAAAVAAEVVLHPAPLHRTAVVALHRKEL